MVKGGKGVGKEGGLCVGFFGCFGGKGGERENDEEVNGEGVVVEKEEGKELGSEVGTADADFVTPEDAEEFEPVGMEDKVEREDDELVDKDTFTR